VVLAFLVVLAAGWPDAPRPSAQAAAREVAVTIDDLPTVSVLVAWKSGNTSRLVRGLVDLVCRYCGPPQDAPRLTRRAPKS